MLAELSCSAHALGELAGTVRARLARLDRTEVAVLPESAEHDLRDELLCALEVGELGQRRELRQRLAERRARDTRAPAQRLVSTLEVRHDGADQRDRLEYGPGDAPSLGDALGELDELGRVRRRIRDQGA